MIFKTGTRGGGIFGGCVDFWDGLAVNPTAKSGAIPNVLIGAEAIEGAGGSGGEEGIGELRAVDLTL